MNTITAAEFYAQVAAIDPASTAMLICCRNVRGEWDACHLYNIPEGWDGRACYPHEEAAISPEWESMIENYR